MTGPLRRQHHRAFRWLTLALPFCLLLGAIGFRLPVYSDIPGPSIASLPENAEREHTEEGEYEGNIRLRIEVFRAPVARPAGASRRWVRVTFLDSVRQPDLLAYWSSKSSTFEEPPLGSFLLGVIDPRAAQVVPLPPQADFLRGYLVIYSLGERVLITQAILPQPI